jgi:hypothetical protein
VPDFPKWMGIEGNILDLYNSEQSDTNTILGYFVEQCVAAYKINQLLCPLASTSIKAKDPVANLLGKINSVVTTLKAKPLLSRQKFSIYNLGYDVPVALGDTTLWRALASEFRDLKKAIRDSTQRRRSLNQTSANGTFPPEANPGLLHSSLDSAAFSRGYNIFMNPAVKCLDANYEDINNVTSFVEYISGLINANIWNFEGVEAARCLSWPNLTAFNVERFRERASPQLNNKIIVIGITHNAWHSYSGALSTYNYFGKDNAVFLIHDAVGQNTQLDPNKCTTNVLTAYFVNGNGSVDEVNL